MNHRGETSASIFTHVTERLLNFFLVCSVFSFYSREELKDGLLTVLLYDKQLNISS